MQRLLYLSVYEWNFNMFCIVFYVRNTIFICVSRKSFVVFLTSFPLHIYVAHFGVCCCQSMCACCFCGQGVH